MGGSKQNTLRLSLIVWNASQVGGIRDVTVSQHPAMLIVFWLLCLSRLPDKDPLHGSLGVYLRIMDALSLWNLNLVAYPTHWIKTSYIKESWSWACFCILAQSRSCFVKNNIRYRTLLEWLVILCRWMLLSVEIVTFLPRYPHRGDLPKLWGLTWVASLIRQSLYTIVLRESTGTRQSPLSLEEANHKFIRRFSIQEQFV